MRQIKPVYFIFAAALVLLIAIIGFSFSTPTKATEKTADTKAVADDSTPAWTKRCSKKGDHCEIFQRLTIKENNKRLIEMAVGYPGKGKNPQAVVVLPLGLLLTKGVTFQIDDGKSLTAPIQTCSPSGCISIVNVAPDFLKVLEKGKVLNISFVNQAGKILKVKLSLSGFADKLETVS